MRERRDGPPWWLIAAAVWAVLAFPLSFTITWLVLHA